MELADRWHTHTRVLSELAVAGILPARLQGGYVPFVRVEVVEYIEAQWPALRAKVAGMSGDRIARFERELKEKVAGAPLGDARVERAWLIRLRLGV